MLGIKILRTKSRTSHPPLVLFLFSTGYFPLIIFLAACTPHPATPPAAPTGTFQPFPSSGPIRSPSLTSRPSPFPTVEAVVAPTSVKAGFHICSPLLNVKISRLVDTIVNPYYPPKPGFDDPHSGVDLADRRSGDSIALAGLPVEAVLDGKVSTIINDRFPFGNAVIIETVLDTLPTAYLDQLLPPTPAPTLVPRSALTCPPLPVLNLDESQRSLYILYAHLHSPVKLKPGDEVRCGQNLGAIGSSGNALNPHLHLEVRTGPGGAQFSSLAHYDNSVTQEEMANYCLWTVSGVFQLMDPMRLFTKTGP